jgi:hypothetical protein
LKFFAHQNFPEQAVELLTAFDSSIEIEAFPFPFETPDDE